MYTIIDGGCFKNMLIGAYQMFEQKYEILNQLMGIQEIIC